MMKFAMGLAAAIMMAACSADPADAPSPNNGAGENAASQITAFVGANIIPMDGSDMVEVGTVIVEGDRITAVFSSGEIDPPEGAEIIDAAGQFLIPGLAEMHAHIPSGNSGWATEDILFLYVSQGVTTARGMQGGSGQLKLRARANAGDIISPTLYLAAPSMSGNSVRSPAQGVERVRKAKDDGWDLLKVHEGLSRETYDAIADTANELEIPFGGHVSDEVGLQHAANKGQRTVDHLDNYLDFMGAETSPVIDEALSRAVALTKGAGMGVVPTMALWEYFAAKPGDFDDYNELRFVPKNVVDGWARRVASGGNTEASEDEQAIYFENRRKLLKALADGGAEILLGSDAPQLYSVPGFSIHREMAAMAEAGMTPAQILHSGTAAPRAYFAEKDTFGQIAPGNRADLILVGANPLDDISNASNINGVMVRGRWLSRDDIDARQDELAAKYGN
ncbi:MAG: amidohydrolase family protein [Marinicaulis sp.]|nr:amidohydrolase family protein [Marinicaulis sp.]NNE41594.1 amidohydrolase family protein [Marinicaulis sp.]NNL89362.1 amidohydrolase family protein [Marinicaulis sp.]